MDMDSWTYLCMVITYITFTFTVCFLLFSAVWSCDSKGSSHSAVEKQNPNPAIRGRIDFDKILNYSQSS